MKITTGGKSLKGREVKAERREMNGRRGQHEGRDRREEKS